MLVVEDDASQRALFRRWLEIDGHTVVPTASGEEALDGLSQALPDAVCLDLELGGLTGLEVLDRIRAREPHLSVVILTADDTVESAVQATKLGAFDYLTKPVDRAKLTTTVRNAIERTRMTLRLIQLEQDTRRSGQRAILGESPLTQRLLEQIERVAATDVTVLIRGESGTGKELVARAIHESSTRGRAPLITLNCAAIPQSLQESELFGHERGAFTGAVRRREGRFELADGGTLFLDEVGELGPDLQPKLLRVLQERRFQRVGGNQDVESDFRLLTATNRDLRSEVAEGTFREDLFFRIAVFDIEVPALRDRGSDVILLADRFARNYGERHRGRRLRIHPETADHLTAYDWPGNVRELQNAVQHAAVLADADAILPRHLPDHIRSTGTEPFKLATPNAARSQRTLKSVERETILAAMQDADGNVSEAARRLGMGRTTLYARLKEYGLR